MPDSRTTATLDQLAARITTHREQNPPQVAALLDYEQTFMTNLLATFPELDPAQLGGVLLFVGAQLAELAANLPEQMRPNSAPIVVNVVQMAGERLYTGKPPVTWACPYTLVGGGVYDVVDGAGRGAAGAADRRAPGDEPPGHAARAEGDVIDEEAAEAERRYMIERAHTEAIMDNFVWELRRALRPLAEGAARLLKALGVDRGHDTPNRKS